MFWFFHELFITFVAASTSKSLKPFSPMATATYTPTHCPDTGRKFTKAERKAANKAKFKAELAAKVKPKRKPKPATASTPKATQDLFRAPLMRLTKAQLVDMILGTTEDVPAAAPKRKPKRKKAAAPKARKATPQERTADRQDRTHHGRPAVGPITPQPEAPKADVSHAREVARATGARNRRQRAFELATSWAFDGTYGGTFLPTQQAELTRLLGSTDVSTYEDVVAITH